MMDTAKWLLYKPSVKTRPFRELDIRKEKKMDPNTAKARYIDYFKKYIKREGADALLEYMEKQTDFFTAPASTIYHLSCEGGLCQHSANVFECLWALVHRKRAQETYQFASRVGSDESVAIVALLHDLCKANTYKPGFRNVKNETTGAWEKVPTYTFDDQFPYGHGEKSVYLASKFIKLTDEEAMAIRYHMGFSVDGDKKSVGAAFEKYPLAFAASVADMEATYFMEAAEKQ